MSTYTFVVHDGRKGNSGSVFYAGTSLAQGVARAKVRGYKPAAVTITAWDDGEPSDVSKRPFTGGGWQWLDQIEEPV